MEIKNEVEFSRLFLIIYSILKYYKSIWSWSFIEINIIKIKDTMYDAEGNYRDASYGDPYKDNKDKRISDEPKTSDTADQH
jgi:hypothetical protein